MAEQSLKYLLYGEDRTASKAIKGVGAAADKSARDVGKGFGTMSASAQKAHKISGAALLGIGGAAVLFGKQSVAAYSDSQESQNKLAFAFQKFPALADTNQASLQKLNATLQMKTRFDDDNIASGQAVLAGFKMTGSQIKATTPLLLDYAAKTGKDAPEAARDFGKAMLGNTKALKNIGISYKMTGDKTKDFNNITALMREKVGGFAAKEGTTAAGKLAILKNQFGELQETVGAKLMPVLTSLVGVAQKVVNWISQNQKMTMILLGAVVGLTAVVYIASAATKLYAAGIAIWTGASKAAAAASKIWAAAQWILNAAMRANPIGLVITALMLLGAGLVLAYKKSDTFRKIVDGAFKAVAATGRWLWENVLKPVFNFIGTTVKWLYQNVFRHYFALIGAALKVAAGVASWLWTSVIRPVFAAIGDRVRWLYNNVIRPVFASVGLAFRGAGIILRAVWNNVIRPVLTAIGDRVRWLYNSVIKPVADRIGASFTGMGAALRAVRDRVFVPVLRYLAERFLWFAGAIIDGAARAFGWVPGIGPKLRAAQKQFAAFRDSVNRSISGVKSRTLKVGVNFGAGIAGPQGKIYKAPISSAGRLAKGGVIRGGTKGQDSVLGLLMPDEFVVRADGSNLRDAIRYYGARAMRFAAGGVVPKAGLPSAKGVGTAVGAGFGALARSVDWNKAFMKMGGGGFMGGGGTGGGAGRWASTVLAVLAMLGQSASNLGAVLRLINKESGGNPRAINNWDINARNGTPSMGLIQTIMPTFMAYAGRFAGLGPMHPFANIYAGLRYAISRYGSIGRIDPLVHAGGYDSGGMLRPGLSSVYNGTGRPERVLNARHTAKLDRLLAGGGDGQPIHVHNVVNLDGRPIHQSLLKLRRTSGMSLGLT